MIHEIAKLPGLRLTAELKDGSISFQTKGLLKPIGNAIAKMIEGYITAERPIKATEEEYIVSGWIPRIPSEAFTRLIKNQVKIKMRKKRIPEQVSIAVTGRCPCNCIFCCAKGIRAEPELTLEEMKSIIDQSVAMGTHLLTLDGGETLLRKDIYDIVSHAHSTGCLTVMFTNGLYLTREVADRLKESGLDTLQISIDSPYEKEHDEIRQVPGIFSKAIAGAKEAVEAGLLVSLYYVARPENSSRETLEDLLKLTADVGAQEVTIYDIIAIGKWLQRENDTLSREDRQRTIDFHKEVNIKRTSGPKVMAFSHFEHPDQFGCMAGRRWMHIAPAGDVIPCSYTPVTFGNIREMPLKKIWSKLTSHRAYKTEKVACMIQDKEFRKRYIYTIPEDAQLPYPMAQLKSRQPVYEK